MTMFLSTVVETFAALVPLVVVTGAGALLAHYRVLDDAVVAGLSRAVVHVFLPALIFSQTVAGLDPQGMPTWWLVPLSALAMFALGLALTLMVFPRESKRSRDVIPLGFMHNAGYFVIALGAYLAPDDFDRFSAYVFLFVLGNSPLLWSVGKAYMTRNMRSMPLVWRQFLTPPLFANLSAVFLVLTGASGFLPLPLLQGVSMAGTAAVPVALVVLGASLAGVRLTRRTDWSLVLRCALVKMVLLPAAVIAVLHLSGYREAAPLLLFMLVLQAVSPHAINLIILVRTYGGDPERTGSVILTSYLIGLITIPLWISLWISLG